MKVLTANMLPNITPSLNLPNIITNPLVRERAKERERKGEIRISQGDGMNSESYMTTYAPPVDSTPIA